MARSSVSLVALLWIAAVPCSAQLKVTGGQEAPKDYLSPVTFEFVADSLGTLPIKATWIKTEQRSLVCEAVSVERIAIRKQFHKKGTELSLTFEVKVKVRPPQDKIAILKVELRNDDEALEVRRSGDLPRFSLTMRIDAEEGRSTEKVFRVRAKAEDFERILAGENPRLAFELSVEDNYE